MADKPVEPRRNSLQFDPEQKCLVVTIYFDTDQAICMGLGSLEVAKDQIKMIGAKIQMDRRAAKPGIIIPGENGNGNGGLHAI